MKKLLIIVFLLLAITGCENKKEKEYEEVKTQVKEKIVDIESVSEEKIKESYLYIKENYTQAKKKEVNSKLIEHTTYLETITQNNQNNKLYKLAISSKNYLIDSKKEYLSEIRSLLNSIENTEEETINDAYLSYHTSITIENIIKKQNTIASADANDKNMVTKQNINNAINYLSNNINNPLENDEILERIIYYSIFLTELGPTDNEISILGEKTLSYIKSLNQNELSEIINLLNSIKKDQNTKVSAFYDIIKK